MPCGIVICAVLHLHLPSMPPPCTLFIVPFLPSPAYSVARRLIPKDCILISLVDWLTLKFSQWKCWWEVVRREKSELFFPCCLHALAGIFSTTCIPPSPKLPPSGPFFFFFLIILALSGVKELYFLLELLILGVFIFLPMLVYGHLTILSPYIYTYR